MFKISSTSVRHILLQYLPFPDEGPYLTNSTHSLTQSSYKRPNIVLVYTCVKVSSWVSHKVLISLKVEFFIPYASPWFINFS